MAFQGNYKTNTDAHIEMRRYMEEKVIPRFEDSLLWWMKKESTFPVLSKVATRCLGAAATS